MQTVVVGEVLLVTVDVQTVVHVVGDVICGGR